MIGEKKEKAIRIWLCNALATYAYWILGKIILLVTASILDHILRIDFNTGP